jgi:hypothetical protein
MKKTIPFIVILLLLLPAFSLSAMDFGLLLDQTIGAGGADNNNAADGIYYSGTFVPWLSMPLDSLHKGTRLFLSAGFTEEYAGKNASFLPELLRVELTFPVGEGMEIKAGRMQYADPLGFIAAGLFDGARFSFAGGNIGTFGVGAWYTGLLSKKSAQITMTEKERVSFNTEIDYKKFTGTYFAPSRILFAFDWDNPYMTEWLRLKAALIGQFDLSGNETLNSQYMAVKAVIPVNSFVFNFGGCLELIQASVQNNISLIGELCIAWIPPTPIRDKLSLTGQFSSGTLDDIPLVAFVPVTTVNQGYILKANISGLSTICLDYTARLLENLSLNVSSAYFFLNDPVTYKGLPSGKGGPPLGNEFFGRLIGSPLSDLQFNRGGGVFLPSMGKADKTAGQIWRVELNAVIAFF